MGNAPSFHNALQTVTCLLVLAAAFASSAATRVLRCRPMKTGRRFVLAHNGLIFAPERRAGRPS